MWLDLINCDTGIMISPCFILFVSLSTTDAGLTNKSKYILAIKATQEFTYTTWEKQEQETLSKIIIIAYLQIPTRETSEHFQN